MRTKPKKNLLLLLFTLLTLTQTSREACLTAEQLTFLGFTKSETPEANDKEICKNMHSGKLACVAPGDIQDVIETKLTEMRDAVKKQMNLTIDNFWNITGRWNRLYSKIVEYKANNKWSVKHVVINNNMLARATFTNERYNKVVCRGK